MVLPLEDYGYLSQVLARYTVSRERFDVPAAYAKALAQSWAGADLLAVAESRSWAKGTAVAGGTDLDLFVSLRPETSGSLAEIYTAFFCFLRRHVDPRRQDVSIGVTLGAAKIDLVPGRKQPGPTTDHSLYSNRRRSWIQTNVSQHISLVRRSGRANEIRLLKIWRRRHGLEFPSFALELAALRALAGSPQGALAPNVVAAWTFLRDQLEQARLVDPANSNNVVSDALTVAEKRRVATAAAQALEQWSWSAVLG